MSQEYSLKDNGSFSIKEYNQTLPFSNFLPGIAGEWGIPLWVFYVNRGQAISSFGIKDKDHAILEFFPADKAYSFTPNLGFRTFLKVNQKKYHEPFRMFSHSRKQEEMVIKSSSLEINEDNLDLGLRVSVNYFTLPNAPIGALVRKLSIKNTSKKKLNLEILDGLSRIVPFGSANHFLKDMSRTLEAWMHSKAEGGLAWFKLIVDPKDTSHTKYIEGLNFNHAFYMDKGKKKAPCMIIDPQVIFSQDTSFSLPANFRNKNFKIPLTKVSSGKMPCSFSHFKWNLAGGQERTFYSVFGSSFNLEQAKRFTKGLKANVLSKKESKNEEIIENIKNNSLCVSESGELNQYVKSNYLDNVLRGGYPYSVKSPARNKVTNGVYYIFSRKHGDLERDYNYFQLQPSYFSQGQANYRDINQNRRMDLFFNPALKQKNIIYFLNFIKIDGYNPLIVEGEKLYFTKIKAQELLNEFRIKDFRLKSLMVRGFYLGEFFKILEEEKIKISDKEKLASQLLRKARRQPQAHHGDGYWIDHWRYNLDLIESFLYFYPDKLKELFLSNSFYFWDDEHRIKPRASRYGLRSGRVYQGESIETEKAKKLAIKKRENLKNFLRTKKGKVYSTNLICKLLALILNKSATLDPEGMGIEMEADKPGWCDSLNGLPALFGSSVCETFELKRASLLLLTSLKQLKNKKVKDAVVPYELGLFFAGINKLLHYFLATKSKNQDYLWWDKANCLKEDFRKRTFFNLGGRETKIAFSKLERFLENLILKLNKGINKAKDSKSKLHRTYFTFSVTKYYSKKKHLVPVKFVKRALPLYLEAPIHALRVEGSKSIYDNLRKSCLFDKKIKMYRLNASLKDESLEIGRSRIFVPGWLENESIWLHMEYKYLLELLKNGLYKEFFNSFYDCGICFRKPKQYGRSILENSSFLVSSAHPDKASWGRGFVARLSGATAEFVNIWALVCLGHQPFSLDRNNNLSLKFSPLLPGKMFTRQKQSLTFKERKFSLDKNTFSFVLFSSTLVVYHNPKRINTFDSCRVEKIVVESQGTRQVINSGLIKGFLSQQIRKGEVERIDIYLK